MPAHPNKYAHRSLGEQLQALRGELTQAEFAEKLGVALRTYHRYEKGEREIPPGLLKLAKMMKTESDTRKENGEKPTMPESALYVSEKVQRLFPDIAHYIQMLNAAAELGDEELFNHVKDTLGQKLGGKKEQKKENTSLE